MIPFTCLAADGVTIAGAIFPAPSPSRGAVVVAHGLPAGKPPSDAEPDEGYPGLARKIAALGLDTAIFNFRGTGESGGHLDIDLWPLDLGAVLDHLDRSELRRPRYAVVAFSAGGAAAITRSADDARLDPLIGMAAPADYGFLPLGTDAEAWFQFYRKLGMIRPGYPGTAAEWAARFRRVAPREAIARSQAKAILLVHGEADETVPVAHAYELQRAAGRPVELRILPGVGHQLRRDSRGVDAMIEILRQRG
jgi:alpha-beta hydrolase superfamily lysophospholipase